MRKATPLALLLALGLALSACGRDAGTSTDDARPTSSDDPRFLPLNAYDMTDAEVHTVGVARWTLAGECMRKLGFDGLRDLDTDPVPDWPRRPAGTGVAELLVFASDDLRYGVHDPKQAAAYGYRGARAAYERRHPGKKWTLPEYLALTGEFVGDDPRSVHGHPIPERGCLGRATRRIHGTDPLNRQDPVLDLLSRSLRQAKRDPAWKKADKEWSACMRASGYRYATPEQAQEGRDRERQELEDRLSGSGADPDEPTGPEKRTATADARCKQRTDYIRTVHAIDVRVQNRLITGHREELEKQRGLNDRAVRTARGILDARS